MELERERKLERERVMKAGYMKTKRARPSRKSRAGKRKHAHVVMAGYYPEVNRYELLHPRCESCQKPYKGVMFQTKCSRPGCAKTSPKTFLRGERRGTLTVAQYAGNGPYWRCKCDCGSTVVKSEAELSGKPSCGRGCQLAGASP